MNENEPQFPAASTRMPRGLSPDEQSFWHALAPELIERELLSIADLPAFLKMSQFYAISEAAFRIIRTKGIVAGADYLTAQDQRLLRIHRDAATQLRLFATVFGMTPSSRSKIAILGQPDLDPLDALFQQRVEVRKPVKARE